MIKVHFYMNYLLVSQSHNNIKQIFVMRPNRPKLLCKFKQNCKHYKEGKECLFSHEKCSRGQACENKETCMYFHQSQSTFQPKEFKKQSKFQKPKSEVECRFGMRCTKRLEGKCGFKHTQGAQNLQQINPEPRQFEKPVINKAEVPCHFGAKCTAFPLGKCPYKHQMSRLVPKKQVGNVLKKQQNHKAIFQSLCVQFLSNSICNQACPKLHEYSQTKSITKIFQLGNCENQIKKIVMMEPYAVDEQPLYIVFGNNRIAFTQLTNMAKETGNENVGNSSLVMKRWCDQDIQFQGAILEDFWIAKIEQQNQRADILVCKCNSGIKIVAFNRDVYSQLPLNEDILSVISFSSYLFILLKTGVTIHLNFDFKQNGFEYKGEPFSQKLILLKKCYKNPQDEEIAVGVLTDGGLCFINKQLQTQLMSIRQRVIDLVFSQYTGIPVALVITDIGKLYAINVLTFEAALLLSRSQTRPNLLFSRLAYIHNHLFIAIDNFGVLVYNSQKFDKPIGVMALGSNKWQIQNDQRGNLVLIGEGEGGNRDVSIFKVRKI